MLYVLIPTAWLAAMLFGLAMCRLAALSDHAYLIALAEWIAASQLLERDAAPAERASGELPFEHPRGSFRATG